MAKGVRKKWLRGWLRRKWLSFHTKWSASKPPACKLNPWYWSYEAAFTDPKSQWWIVVYCILNVAIIIMYHAVLHRITFSTLIICPLCSPLVQLLIIFQVSLPTHPAWFPPVNLCLSHLSSSFVKTFSKLSYFHVTKTCRLSCPDMYNRPSVSWPLSVIENWSEIKDFLKIIML